MTHTIDASQVAPDPTLNGTMATSFNPKSASLRYRVRDSSGTMRTIEVSATPAPVEIILRPVDVTQAIGDVEIDRSEALAVGALTVAVTSIKFTGKAAAPAMGGFDIAAHGVPLWAGGAVFELELCIRTEAAQGIVELDLRTQDGALFEGSFMVPAAAVAAATVRVTFRTATTKLSVCADGNRRPVLAPTAGSTNAQFATVTLRRAAGTVAPLYILGMSWRIAVDPTATVYAAPALATVPLITGSTAVAELAVPLNAHQTRTGTGALVWTIVGAPAGVSVDRLTGVLTVARGARVEVTANNGPVVTVSNVLGATAEQALGFRVTV